MDTYTYRQAADEGFLRIVDLWQKKPFTPDTFWFAANTLQVILDYLVTTSQRDSHGFVVDSLQIFDDIIKDRNPLNWAAESARGFWLDDYGWWGVALMKAYAFKGVLGLSDDLSARVLQYAKNCWIGLHHGWQNTAVSPDVPIIGGIPNTTDHSLKLAGKNCVTNELFWLLSLLLNSILEDNSFLDPSTNSAQWFLEARDQSRLLSDKGLVYERLSGTPYFDPSWTWLGDQGLFLQSCLDSGVTNLKMSDDIAAAVRKSCVHENGVLDEDHCKESQYYLAYATGKGIFMRALQLLNAHNQQEKSTLRYDDWIKSNAIAVWNNRLSDGNFPFYWNKEAPEHELNFWGAKVYGDTAVKLVLHANGMAALTAALEWFSSEKIPQTTAAVVA